VLAMVSAPSYDPDLRSVSPEAYQQQQDDPRRPWVNRTCSCAWTPKQELQVFEALSAALSGQLDAEAEVPCQVAGAAPEKPAAEVKLNLRTALEKASPHYFAQAVARLTDHQYFDGMGAFGFAQLTGVELPEESRGQMALPPAKQTALEDGSAPASEGG